MTSKTDYLGDGVYASFDGYHIWLSTERERGVESIALEPAVYQALRRYAQRVCPPGHFEQGERGRL